MIFDVEEVWKIKFQRLSFSELERQFILFRVLLL